MEIHSEDAPLALADTDQIRDLRDVLEGRDYREARILEMLGTRELPPAHARAQLFPLWRHRIGLSELGDLVRLFLLGDFLTAQEFCRAIHPQDPEQWRNLGLVRLGPEGVAAAFQLLPFGEMILAADWPGQPAGMARHVMEIGGSSRTLADFTIRLRARRTLDLGTGCGFQALLAAGHSDRVWGVDCNPRALNLAQFNARLNGLHHIQFAQGDLFEPVQGETFDLVVGNLPFVICPESQYLYCQGGLPADEFCRNVIQRAPAVLREGGCCQLVSDLAHIKGEDFRERLKAWTRGTGCDAWIIYSLTVDPATYTARWLKETGEADLNRQGGRFDAWIAHYQEQRIEAISFGLIALRRRAGGKNWFHCEEAPNERTPGGEEIVLGFALRDFLEGAATNAALQASYLRCSPDLRWDQELEPAAEGWNVIGSRLRAARSGPPGVEADPATLFIVARCRGERPLGDILRELAAALGQAAETVLPSCLERVRHLIERGLLLPVVQR